MSSPYDYHLPCLNSSCKSFGTPHPNCKCYFAGGGEVGYFCSAEKPHDKGCEYYMESGGNVPSRTPEMINPTGDDPMRNQPTVADQPAASDQPTTAPPPTAPIQQPVETADNFDPIDFVQQHEAQPTGFDPNKFVNDYEGVGGEQPDNAYTSTLGQNFNPADFVQQYEGTSQSAPESLSDQIKVGAEGFSQGYLSDIAKVLEVKSGMSTLPAIEQRQADYPTEHAVMKMAGIMSSWMGGPAEKISTLAGSKILGNVLAGVAFSAGDNITKSLLGQPGGDPKTAVAASLIDGGISGLTNAAVGGLFSGAGAAFEAMPQAAQKSMQWLAKNPVSKAIRAAEIATLGSALVTHTVPRLIIGDAAYTAVKNQLHPVIKQVLGNTMAEADKYAGDALLNAMSKTNFFGIPAAIQYAQRITNGMTKINGPIESMFKAGAQQYVSPTKDRINKEIRDWMDGGGIIKEYQDYHYGFGAAGSSDLYKRDAPQRRPTFADGGEVAPDQQTNHFANLYPTENILLNETRGRVSNYLNSLRPTENYNKAPFDEKMPQKEKERAYRDAVEIAGDPVSILKHVNNGTLTPDLMKHFTSMYPEVHDLFSKRITERMVQAQLKDEKPPYSKRQSMSLFLGTDLDSSFSPIAIQTIQALYANKQAPQQPQAPVKNKKGTSSLSKGPSAHLTDDQAREQRMQNQKA